MKPHKLHLKVYVEQPADLDPETFVPVFHQWVKTKRVADELLIDVADYTHVHQGPSILLVGHGVDYYLDEGEGRAGLLVVRKREAPPEGDRLKDAFKKTLEACQMLENEESLSGLRFGTSEMLFRISDRLLAPNTRGTYDSIHPEVRAFTGELFGGSKVTLEQEGSERDPFTLRLKADGAPDLSALVSRLS